MTKKLVITEKPSVAKDLAKVLGTTQKTKTYYEGDQYVITWAYGHLLSLKLPEDIKKEWQQWQLETLPIIPKQIGQLAVYFLQQRFAHNGNEADDLKLIEGQIVRALRK